MQRSKGIHLPTLLMLAVSGLGLVFTASIAVGLAGFALASLLSGGFSNPRTLAWINQAWTSGFLSMLLLPAVVISLLRLIGRPAAWHFPKRFRVASILMVLWPVFLIAGQAIHDTPQITWLLLPPIQILSVAIPIWFFVELGRRGLTSGSAQRQWGLVSFGIVVTPIVIIGIEIILVVFLFILVFAWLISQPEMASQFIKLGQQLRNQPAQPEKTLEILLPYLQKPAVIFVALAMMAGVIPVIEEMFKPLGVWALVNRKLTPAEGFTAGLICGSIFALVESLSTLSAPNESWATLVFGRMGTGLLHTTTTALVCWGLVSAWSRAKYLQLGLIFMLAAGLHAAWNLFALVMGISTVFPTEVFVGDMSLFKNLGGIAPVALFLIMVLLLLILTGGNRILRQEVFRHDAQLPAEFVPVLETEQPDRDAV